MRHITLSAIFLLLLIASTAKAQIPTPTSGTLPTGTVPSTSTGTIPSTATATLTPCPPPTVETEHGSIEWFADSLSPGSAITFLVSYLGYDCEVLEGWNVNGEFISAAENLQPFESLVVTMPDSCQLDVKTVFDTSPNCTLVATAPEPFTPTPTLTPTPTSPPEPISIPEPVTLTLFGAGIAALVGYAAARRRP